MVLLLAAVVAGTLASARAVAASNTDTMTVTARVALACEVALVNAPRVACGGVEDAIAETRVDGDVLTVWF